MSKRLRLFLLLGLPVALLIPLFLGIPIHLRYDPLIGPLGSRYHVALFLVLTLLLYSHGPLKGRLTLVVLTTLALGAVTEVVQGRFGRSTSLADWVLDAQGVGFAVCWIWHRRSGRRLWPLLGATLLLLLVAWPLRHLPVTVPESRAAQARFPVLDDFERPRALVLWQRQPNVERTLVEVPGRGQVLQIDNEGQERWPGVTTRSLPWDWSEQTHLVVDCRLIEPSPEDLRLTLWIEDRASPQDIDFAMMSFTIGHQWQTVAAPLEGWLTHNRRRPVDGSVVTCVSVFVSRRTPGPVAFQIDNLRLENRTAEER